MVGVTAGIYGAVMVCFACSEPAAGALCVRCAATMRPAPDRFLGSGLLVVAAFAHEGAARRMVHGLKYRAVAGVADHLAAHLVGAAAGIEALVPVPRAVLRRAASGTDPAAELAAALGRRTGVPVVRALGAPLWWPRHAGRSRQRRPPIRFRQLRPVAGSVALVDDVVTTGSTLSSAADALSTAPARALVATSAGRVRVG